jgi:hypothetical protein
MCLDRRVMPPQEGSTSRQVTKYETPVHVSSVQLVDPSDGYVAFGRVVHCTTAVGMRPPFSLPFSTPSIDTTIHTQKTNKDSDGRR